MLYLKNPILKVTYTLHYHSCRQCAGGRESVELEIMSMSHECICAEKYADLTYFAFYGFLSVCRLAQSSSLLLLTCHLPAGNNFVIENKGICHRLVLIKCYILDIYNCLTLQSTKPLLCSKLALFKTS